MRGLGMLGRRALSTCCGMSACISSVVCAAVNFSKRYFRQAWGSMKWTSTVEPSECVESMEQDADSGIAFRKGWEVITKPVQAGPLKSSNSVLHCRNNSFNSLRLAIASRVQNPVL